MKKITFNAPLNHKAYSYEPMQIEVEKVIPLYGKRFEQMKNHPLDDCPEIIENRDLMYMEGGTAHCILFLDANGSDGILVEAEGSDYARKSQFIPNARAIVEANDITAGERQLHAELKAMADRIAELAHTGQKHFIFEDMLGDEDLRVLMIRTVAEMLGRREDLAEVRDHYLGIRGQADFTVTAKPAQEMKLYCPLEIQAEPQIYETDFLSCFGGLTLRIPSYRYMKRISSPKNNSDLELEVIVNPAFFITDDFSSEDIIESKQYAKDIGDFLGIENLIPVGSSSEYEEFFMAINGEFVYAYEGCCLCLGTTFEGTRPIIL